LVSQTGYEKAFCRLLSFSFSFFSFTGLYFFLAKQRYFRNREERLSPSLHLASAAEAGALVSICTNPIWLIRTRLELQNPLHQSRPYSGVYDALRTILREEGWTALYTRLGPGLLMQVSHGVIQFTAYEELRRIIMVDYEERKKKPKGASNLLVCILIIGFEVFV
ncbi:folate transporter 1, chloroplastic-like, partial [Gossypium raimondii]|uniref:folate transporter 1, chloroplastic-like n=1 Tax=Gossypium raimondii TaxID=29730 RepID=UPI00227D4F65